MCSPGQLASIISICNREEIREVEDGRLVDAACGQLSAQLSGSKRAVDAAGLARMVKALAEFAAGVRPGAGKATAAKPTVVRQLTSMQQAGLAAALEALAPVVSDLQPGDLAAARQASELLAGAAGSGGKWVAAHSALAKALGAAGAR
mmetsp:Transcript_17051/g.42730  ORF Transcript_17051/g.42730 Transcript_17051/m.42730 type:complete len:148 (-) Transcript_17051:356-799(-)